MKGYQMFSGYKTYIVAAVAILTAVGAYLVGDLPIADAAQAVLTAILAATIRNGVAAK